MKLVDLLKNKTEESKVAYIEIVANWARVQFARLEEFVAVRKEYSSFFEHLTKEERRDAWSSRTADAHRAYRAYDNKFSASSRSVEKGIEAYIAFWEAQAVEHYESAINKLAQRIEKKNMNQDKLEIVTQRLDLNFETTITDETQTVRAFTIIASGEVQRPHYRYLVK